MHRSLISWCDYSGGYANFVWRGKRKGDCEISPGCASCYVTRCWVRHPDLWPDETTFYPDKLEKLHRCRPRDNGRPYRRGYDRPMVFPNDTGDLFHANVPDWFIFRALDVFYIRGDVDWQILTKRAERAANVINTWLKASHYDRLPPWMWIMFSAEDQQRLNERLPFLASIPAAVRGLSVEPMIGPVTLPGWVRSNQVIHWIVAGGETGSKARPANLAWVRHLRDQCIGAGIPFHFKAWGEYAPMFDGFTTDIGYTMKRVGRRVSGRQVDGREWNEFPEILRW